MGATAACAERELGAGAVRDGEGAPDLDAARRGLLRKRGELTGTLRSMREGDLGESLREGLGELSAYDNHPADLGTETWKRSQRLAIADTLSRTLEEVEAALRRCDAGEYGLCASCGRPIPVERLRAIPEAALCVDCQRAAEADRARAPGRQSGRPIEEELLSPPFARTWNDGSGRVGFDGEDAWQAVARFGSSDTPSDLPQAHRHPHVRDDPDEPHGAVRDVENIAAADGDPVAAPQEQAGDL